MGFLGKMFTGGNPEAPSRDIAQQSAGQSNILDLYQRTPPTVPNVDLTGLAQLTETLNRLNAYKSLQLQQELRPDVAAGEVLADKQILADARNPISPEEQRDMATAGLEQKFNAGGTGTRGDQIARSVFGRLNSAQRMAKMDRLARWTQAHPAPTVGLSAESAGNIRAGVPFNIANVLNNQRGEMLGATSAGFGNSQKLLHDYVQLGLAQDEARKRRNDEMAMSAVKMFV